MFPYPSGDGLHVGHPEGYTATDIVSRFARMRGKHVLHPMGWDAFGLPAEQHAIKTGHIRPKRRKQNIDTFRRQLKMLGFSYDWSREISTTDENYYRWTQWIFLQLYDTWYDPDFEWTGPDGVQRIGKGRPISELPIPESLEHDDDVRRYQDQHRLAYQSNAPVNWCPALGTVLANEEVTADGKSDRGNHPVERRKLRQWMLRITAYAERLLTELDDLDWTESIKLLQRNWIGKSLGAEVDFYVGDGSTIESQQTEFAYWKEGRKQVGFPAEPGDLVLAGLHDPARHAVRCDLHGRRSGASDRRQASPPKSSGRRSTPIEKLSAARAISTGPTSRSRRPASSPGRTPSTRSTASRSRSGSPTMC